MPDEASGEVLCTEFHGKGMEMRMKKAAGVITGAVVGAMMLGGGVASATDTPNDNKNLAPWQVCGSDGAIVGGLASLGSGGTAGNCKNAYTPTGSNLNIVPWQVCGSHVPIVAVGVPVNSPAESGDCTNASVN